MALDEALMAELPLSRTPVLRLYRWRTPCLSVGYFQSVARDIDLERCRVAGVAVVRRPTGGRAILHRWELSYSLAALETDPLFTGGVLRSYARVSRGLVAAMGFLGVAAQAIPPRRQTGTDSSPACFDAIAGYEVAVEGKKLVGSAQVRRGGVVLQQGTILLRSEPEALFYLLRYPDEGSRMEAQEKYCRWVTSLEQMLGDALSFPRLLAATRHGLSEGLGVQLAPGRLTAEERAAARRLVKEKYSRPEWNLRR